MVAPAYNPSYLGGGLGWPQISIFLISASWAPGIIGLSHQA
jgi:hypothetical protein